MEWESGGGRVAIMDCHEMLLTPVSFEDLAKDYVGTNLVPLPNNTVVLFNS